MIDDNNQNNQLNNQNNGGNYQYDNYGYQANDYSNYDYYQDPNADQAYQYDQYYGGTSMQYNADQIAQYEQNYDQNYADQYQDYYANYYQQPSEYQGTNDQLLHKQQYEYYLQNLDYMRQCFPKKVKIIRWEDIDRNYNSLDQTNQFIEWLEQYQQETQDNNKDE